MSAVQLNAIQVALDDFKIRYPDSWQCYSVDIDWTDGAGGTVNFASPAVVSMDEQDVSITLGGAGVCGPGLSYRVDMEGDIVAVIHPR
jgi:hypothetical protein